jgi:hypothetical protein
MILGIRVQTLTRAVNETIRMFATAFEAAAAVASRLAVCAPVSALISRAVMSTQHSEERSERSTLCPLRV